MSVVTDENDFISFYEILGAFYRESFYTIIYDFGMFLNRFGVDLGMLL